MSMYEKLERDKSFLSTSYTHLRGFRVTGVATAEKCLKKFQLEYIRDPSLQTSNVWAKIGTAVHIIAEQTLRLCANLPIDSEELVEATVELQRLYAENENGKLKPSELANYYAYFARLREYMKNCDVIALETEIEIPLGGAKPVYGQIDALLYNRYTGQYILLDHKTNRKKEDELDWSRKLQPQLYAYAIARWIGLSEINVAIGRANYDTDLFWLYQTESLIKIAERGRTIVDKIDKAANTNQWPATGHKDECMYCTLKDSCPSAIIPYRQLNKGGWRNTLTVMGQANV